jgi:AcrR family transcriptional regulator
MARNYTLKRRAETKAETRQKIVDAAVALHGEIGPAQTTISMIADRAGVQRHTLYAHFPDERSVLMACSGHVAERDPMPDAEPWRALKTPKARLTTGLRALYDWFARNKAVVGCALRDSEHHALVREIMALRFGSPLAVYHDVLGEGLNSKQRAMLALALSFHTWRTLTDEAKLGPAEAVAAMTQAVTG